MSEAQTYIERFRELRGNALKTLDGLDSGGLNFKPTRKNTNSLFILATHLLGSERYWIHQVVGQRAVERDRDAEFRARGKNADALKAAFDEATGTTDGILAALTSADFDKDRETNREGRLRTARWCVLHMIEHYSEHGGHMNLTRQLWEERGNRLKPKAQSVKRNAKSAKPNATSRKRKK